MTKDKISEEKSQQTQSVKEWVPAPKKVRRPGPRVRREDGGPLQEYMRYKIPGFHLYLANPREIPYLLSDDVGYDYVHPKEVDARDDYGNPVEGDQIRIATNDGGRYGIVLKLPVEYFTEDLQARMKAERDKMVPKAKTDSAENISTLKSFGGNVQSTSLEVNNLI